MLSELDPTQITPSYGKNKVYSMLEFKTKIEKEYANTPWGKRVFEDLFRWL
jgi:hypothetical protein